MVVSRVARGWLVRILRLDEKREQRGKARQQNVEINAQSEFVCSCCGRDFHARIALLSHSKRCHQHLQQDWFGLSGRLSLSSETEECLQLAVVTSSKLVSTTSYRLGLLPLIVSIKLLDCCLIFYYYVMNLLSVKLALPNALNTYYYYHYFCCYYYYYYHYHYHYYYHWFVTTSWDLPFIFL